MSMSDYTAEDLLKEIEVEESLPEEPARSGCQDGRRFNKGRCGQNFTARPLKPYEGNRGPDGLLGPLHNDEEPYPSGIRQIEKFEHRHVAYLKALGHSTKEIAEMMGLNPQTIRIYLKLPWVHEAIVEEIKAHGRDAVQEFILGSTMECVTMLQDTVTNEKLQTRDRITAAKELLDRAFGKANQPVTYQEKVDLDSLTDDALAKIAFKGKDSAN